MPKKCPLLMSIGERGDPERAQDTELDHAGSTLRLDPQGLAPEDNLLLEEVGFLPGSTPESIDTRWGWPWMKSTVASGRSRRNALFHTWLAAMPAGR
ncbi:hypothetical protein HNO52_18615 [Billgrantia diversa]|uniref:PQQ-dependent sugar dehydrogenase n=1 Tax=Halomonas sp. MCCC 1A13316 TaxID=2733487 RepID=UPI0018A4A363|nr:PQQ-dependent sugar dehydrogenase [Halomonas sp. MCCC 1A13316]QOR40306.1 hypothetical protein HNO52_18615 [Halomonas sp. MCCC 1A13316]